MEPLEYCRAWVELPPHQRGYRKACIELLVKATGLSEATVANWGKNFEKRPDYVTHSLSMADKLKRIEQILNESEL